jgi:hypothetical protein
MVVVKVVLQSVWPVQKALGVKRLLGNEPVETKPLVSILFVDVVRSVDKEYWSNYYGTIIKKRAFCRP